MGHPKNLCTGFCGQPCTAYHVWGGRGMILLIPNNRRGQPAIAMRADRRELIHLPLARFASVFARGEHSDNHNDDRRNSHFRVNGWAGFGFGAGGRDAAHSNKKGNTSPRTKSPHLFNLRNSRTRRGVSQHRRHSIQNRRRNLHRNRRGRGRDQISLNPAARTLRRLPRHRNRKLDTLVTISTSANVVIG